MSASIVLFKGIHESADVHWFRNAEARIEASVFVEN